MVLTAAIFKMNKPGHDRSKYLRLHPFSRLIAIGLCGVTVYFGTAAFFAENYGRQTIDFAATIERDLHANAGEFASLKADTDNREIFQSCNQRINRARVSIALSALDGFQRQGAFDKSDGARAYALAQVRNGLLCAPLDANLWLRKAILELGSVGPTPGVLDTFHLSDKYSPYEGWIIAARLPLYADLATRGLTDFERPSQRDMRSWILGGGDAIVAAKIVTQWPDLLQETYTSALTQVSAKVRQHFEYSLERVALENAKTRKQ
jgi:hypothetical protein